MKTKYEYFINPYNGFIYRLYQYRGKYKGNFLSKFNGKWDKYPIVNLSISLVEEDWVPIFYETVKFNMKKGNYDPEVLKDFYKRYLNKTIISF